jgi:hypothetical protein
MDVSPRNWCMWGPATIFIASYFFVDSLLVGSLTGSRKLGGTVSGCVMIPRCAR